MIAAFSSTSHSVVSFRAICAASSRSGWISLQAAQLELHVGCALRRGRHFGSCHDCASPALIVPKGMQYTEALLDVIAVQDIRCLPLKSLWYFSLKEKPPGSTFRRPRESGAGDDDETERVMMVQRGFLRTSGLTKLQAFKYRLT